MKQVCNSARLLMSNKIIPFFGICLLDKKGMSRSRLNPEIAHVKIHSSKATFKLTKCHSLHYTIKSNGMCKQMMQIFFSELHSLNILLVKIQF